MKNVLPVELLSHALRNISQSCVGDSDSLSERVIIQTNLQKLLDFIRKKIKHNITIQFKNEHGNFTLSHKGKDPKPFNYLVEVSMDFLQMQGYQENSLIRHPVEL